MILAALVVALAVPAAGAAATYVVNVTDDFDFGSCDAFHCSLREALGEADGHPGLDMVTFSIPGAGAHTIVLGRFVLVATDPVVIDGTTQPGFAGTPVVELDGTNASTTQDFPRPDGGLALLGGYSTVRGLVLNRFPEAALYLGGDGHNVVQGNYVGTDLTGSLNRRNLGAGVVLASPANTVGGDTAAERNVISASGGSSSGTGLIRAPGIAIVSGSNGNVVQGNYIGTTANGSSALPNNAGGIFVGGNRNLIGGTAAGEGNLVSGNLSASSSSAGGITLGARLQLGDNYVRANRVQGNLIGTDAAGTGTIGNGGAAILIALGRGNRINAGNVIAHNGRGVVIGPGGTTATRNIENAIRRNSIFANSGLGIDLDPGGVTPNDAGDADIGANLLQNFPVIASAALNGSNVTLTGTLDSQAGTHLLDFFSNASCDSSGNGEGQNFLGSTLVAGGSFNVTFPAAVVTDRFFTATATDSVGNTSEFSACAARPFVADLAIAKTDDPDPAGVGHDLNYHLTATNNGPDPAADVVVRDTLPRSVLFQSASPSQGSCSLSTGIVTCNIGSLPSGGSATVDIVVTPDAAGRITNRGSVASRSTGDPDSSNDVKYINTTVQDSSAWADLALAKTDSPDPAVLGRDDIVYTLTATNSGPSEATSLTLTDTLPASVELVGINAGDWSCTREQPSDNVIVTCTLGGLAGTGTASSVEITVTPTQAGVIENSATVRAAGQFDPNTDDNIVSADTTVE